MAQRTGGKDGLLGVLSSRESSCDGRSTAGRRAGPLQPMMCNERTTQIGFGETDTGRVVTTADPRDGRAVTYDTGNEHACIRYDRDLLEEIKR